MGGTVKITIQNNSGGKKLLMDPFFSCKKFACPISRFAQ
jgi:hypothetical protein